MQKSEKKTTQEEIRARAYEIIGLALVSISNITRAEITKYIQKHKSVTFEELRSVFNLNNNTLSFHLKKLQEGYVISQPKERGPYELGELGELMLRALDRLEGKAPSILKHIIAHEIL